MIVGYGTVFYSFSLLLSPAHEALGLPRDTLVGAFSMALLCSGLCAPWVGMLIDRYGGRGVMTAGSLLAGVMLLALSRVGSAVGFYAAWMGLGVSMSCILYEPAFAVLTRVHGAQARRAITMVTLLGGFASTVFWPLGQWLIEHQGWRSACVTLGLVHLVFGAPAHWLSIGRTRARAGATTLREEPGSRANATALHAEPASRADETTVRGVLPSHPDASEASWTLRRALADPAFYCLAGAFVSYQFVFSSTAVHFIPMMQGKGLSAAEAAAIGAMLGPMQVAGRIVELLFGSRLPITRVGAVTIFFMPLAMAWLYFAPGRMGPLALFPLFYGGGNGIMTIVRGAVTIELYGVARYATISGALAAPALLSNATGPLVSSLLWSPTAGYQPVVLALCAVGLVGAACFHAALHLRRRAPARA